MLPTIAFSVGCLISNTSYSVEDSWEYKHTLNIFKSYRVELRKNNKQHFKYLYFVLTFDCIVNSGCYWDFQYLAFTPVCSLLLRNKWKQKNNPELYREHIINTIIAAWWSYFAVWFQVAEDSVI